MEKIKLDQPTETPFLLELASNRLFLFVRHTDEVAVRTTTQAASGMIHLMAVGIWIWL